MKLELLGLAATLHKVPPGTFLGFRAMPVKSASMPLPHALWRDVPCSGGLEANDRLRWPAAMR